MGGWTKNGFGRFEVGQTTISHGHSDAIEQDLFAPGLSKAEFNQQSPFVLEALDSWAEALANNLSAAELEKLYELRED